MQMRTTINIDDELLAGTCELTGIAEKTALVREALRALIQLETSRRLARLSGTQFNLEPVRRRRAEPDFRK